MDEQQYFLDKLFENPKTLQGLRNKLCWMKARLYDTHLNCNRFMLLKNEIETTTMIVRNFINRGLATKF